MFSLARRFTTAAGVDGCQPSWALAKKKIRGKNRRTTRPARTHPPPWGGRGCKARRMVWQQWRWRARGCARASRPIALRGRVCRPGTLHPFRGPQSHRCRMCPSGGGSGDGGGDRHAARRRPNKGGGLFALFYAVASYWITQGHHLIWNRRHRRM